MLYSFLLYTSMVINMPINYPTRIIMRFISLVMGWHYRPNLFQWTKNKGISTYFVLQRIWLWTTVLRTLSEVDGILKTIHDLQWIKWIRQHSSSILSKSIKQYTPLQWLIVRNYLHDGWSKSWMTLASSRFFPTKDSTKLSICSRTCVVLESGASNNRMFGYINMIYMTQGINWYQ